MPPLDIKTYPNPILRRKSASLTTVTDSDKELFSRMIETMHHARGVGLAAPQIGVSKKLIVVEGANGILKMANPEIVSKKGSDSFEEGCLSVPDRSVNVSRASEITVSYTDENGRQKSQTFTGLTARIIQHEVDHINGKLIIDYLPWYKKILARG